MEAFRSTHRKTEMKSHVVAGPGHNKEEEEQRAWTLLIMQSIPRSAFVSNPKESSRRRRREKDPKRIDTYKQRGLYSQVGSSCQREGVNGVNMEQHSACSVNELADPLNSIPTHFRIRHVSKDNLTRFLCQERANLMLVTTTLSFIML